jgi:hypothetical protein
MAPLPGPVGALLYEANFIGPSRLGLTVVLVLSLAGIVLGVRAVARRRAALGIVALTLNLAVAVLYGFPLLYLGLGGSR